MNERVAAKQKQASPKTQPPARTGAWSVRTGPGALPPVVHEVLRSPGQPLDPATRAFAEPRFGHDFGKVRVHHDVRSAEAARQLDSVAFTSGQHVFFGTGAYRPETPAGRRLVAHELAHTLQQREAQPSVGEPVIQSNPIVSRPGDRLEREAEAAAERVAAGGRLAPGSISPAGTRALISRQVATLPVRDPAGTRLEAEELVEDLAQTILGDLRRDPGDVSGRTRRRLDRLDSSTREAVLERVEALATPDQSMRLAQILAAPAPPEVETPQETEEAPRPEPEDRAPLPEPVPEAVPETSRPETGEVRPGVSPEPGTTPPAGVAEVATTGETGEAAPVAAPSPTEAPADATPLPTSEDAGVTQPAAALTEAVEAAPAAPEVPQLGTGEIPVPEVQAKVPDATAEEAGAAPPEAAPGPTEAPAGAAPLPTSEDATPEADTGPIEELEAEAEELGAGEEEPEAEPEDRAALPEPATEAAETPPPEAGLAETAEAGSDLASPEPTLEGAPEEPAAEEAAPVEAPLAPEEAGEGLAEGGELGEPESGPGAEMNLGDMDLGAALDEDAGTGGEAPAGGGGGGGTPIPEPPMPEVPDVSGADPVQALATVSALPPSRLAVALGGVSAAASRTVNEQRSELAANPPEVERPSGAHGTMETPAAESQAPAVDGPRRVERVPEGRSTPVPRPAPLPPAPAPPTEHVRPPQVGNTPQGAPSAEDSAAVRASLRRLPTHDPALKATAGPPPTLALEGDADPERARDQHARLDQSVAEAREQGQRDRAAAQQIGEILPDVPQEMLTAEVPTGEGGGAAGTAPAAAATPASGAAEGDDEAASIIAQEQQGDQIRASIAQAQADVSTRRQEHTAQVAEHRANAQREMDELVNANAAEQARERTAAHSEVQELGSEWDEAQRGLVDSSRTEADTVAREGKRDLTQERTQAEERAAQHVQDGNREAATARLNAEQQAARERQSAEQESGGILSWVAKQATDFFNAVKNRIQQAFEAARALVRNAIQRAQRLAADVIEAARRNIVGIIRRVGDALISIGDRLLAGFPGLRDRFRAAIRERVARAEAAVNRLAGALKEGVQRALNFLGSALNAALGLLERGMLAAVDAANRAVQGAIQFARSVVQGFAAFAALIRDVAANPGQWIRNFGAAVMDGIRNHLWAALKTAIKEWFNSKVEEVLGLGMMVWRLLSQGGIAVAQVGRMVWEGLKQVIPIALIQILIQRLVSLIIPAVGAVMVIIETLQAAWGTVSRILQAFERFFAFLRAVKGGNAGPHFAHALAAAAVAVIDFVSNFLLMRLRRPAGALAGRIRAIAQRIGQRLKRLAQGIGRRVRQLRARGRRFIRGRREQRRPRQSRRERQQQRLDRAVAAIRPQVEALLRRGTSRPWLWARLQLWRVRYLLSGLDLETDGTIIARINPRQRLTTAKRIDIGRSLEISLYKAERRFLDKVIESRTDQEAEAVAEAERRLEAAARRQARGREHDPRVELPALSASEQIILMRRIRRGEVAAPTGFLPRIEFERGAEMSIISTASMGGFYVRFPRRRRQQPGVPESPLPRRGGSYDELLWSVGAFARRLQISEATILDVARSANASVMTERLRALYPGVPAGSRRLFWTQFAPMVRSLSLLTQRLESARAPGMFPVQELASRATSDPEALLSRERGRLAPMTPLGAARAVEAERAAAEGVAQTRPPSRRADMSPKQREEHDARLQRHERVANVFLRLRTIIRNREIRALPQAEQEAIRRVSGAFERWLELRLRSRRTRAELTAAATELEAALVAFMETIH